MTTLIRETRTIEMTMNRNPKRMQWQAALAPLRTVAAITSFAFLWSFVAFPLAAMAQSVAVPAPGHMKIKLPPLKLYPVPKLAKSTRKPGPAFEPFDYRSVNLAAQTKSSRVPVKSSLKQPPVSLLGLYSEIAWSLSAAQLAGWRAEAADAHTSPARLAQLNVWLGEIALDKGSDPAGAR